VDSEEKVVEEVRTWHLNGLFGEDTFAIAEQQMVDTVLEKLRMLTERTDSLQGFMLIGGLGGGTGSMSAQVV
jgi:hypothetical protein